MATLEQELTALREWVAVQSELLEERACQIADLKEDRDIWFQQPTNLLIDARTKLVRKINLKTNTIGIEVSKHESDRYKVFYFYQPVECMK